MTDLPFQPGPLFAALASAVHAALALWLVLTRDRRRGWPAGIAAMLTVGVALTATWAVAMTIAGPLNPITAIAQFACDGAWILFVAVVAWRAVGAAPVMSSRLHWLAIALLAIAAGGIVAAARWIGMVGGTDILQAGPAGIDAASYADWSEQRTVWQLLLTIGAVLMVDATIRAMPPDARRPMLAVLGGLVALWIYDFNVYLLSYLSERPATVLLTCQPLFAVLVAAPIAIDAFDRPSFRIRPSRAMTYRLVAIALGSAYLLALALLGVAVRFLGGDYGQLVQLLFLAVALVGSIALVGSGRVRSWLQVMLAKHFYEHRYDYRAEWLRFAEAMGDAAGGTLTDRIARATARLVGSPAAIVLVPDAQGRCALDGRYKWPATDGEPFALGVHQAARLGGSRRVVVVDQLRAGTAHGDDVASAPGWLTASDDAWVMVPLVHADRLEGVAVIARPIPDRVVDWEDLDVLRVVGRQAGSYLAEQAGQAALADARRFDDFNRRFAFILHDIKNLASQMSLLAANAERHGDNPAFRKDMLGTLRGASDRLTALIARLSRQDHSRAMRVAPIALTAPITAAIKARAGGHRVLFDPPGDIAAMADADALEQIIGHLVQNAVEASPVGAPVEVTVGIEPDAVIVRVTDTGPGMDAEFVRTRLFQPFQSTKANGIGIGLFEARALAVAMQATLTVDTLPGVGTRFLLTLARPPVVAIDAEGDAEPPATPATSRTRASA